MKRIASLLVLVVVLSACGGGSGSSGPASTASGYTSWWFGSSAASVSVRCETSGSHIDCSSFNKTSGSRLGACFFLDKGGQLYGIAPGAKPITKPYTSGQANLSCHTG